jgi:hypothetical protein
MVKIGARVLDFTVLLGLTTAAGLGYARIYGQTDEEKETILKAKYPDLVAQSQANRRPLQDHLNAIKRASNPIENNLSTVEKTANSSNLSEKLEGSSSPYDKKFDDLLKKGKST